MVDQHRSLYGLLDAGYVNVERYAEGLSDWEAVGLPLEGDWA